MDQEEEEFKESPEDVYTNHLNEVEEWPEFVITNDRISGRIPVAKIKSWKKFQNLIDHHFFKQKEDSLIYRGLKKYKWTLTPTLARLTKSGVVRKEAAEKLLNIFRLSIRGRIKDYSLLDEDDELWAVGQHHGLKTPLLDWSHSPYVALFFAFGEIDDEADIDADFEDKDNKYRCVYILDKHFVENEREMQSVRVYEPKKDGHGRLVNQAGLFTISDYGTTIETEIVDFVTTQIGYEELSEQEQVNEIAQYICKIYIPNDAREECLKYLRKMNVHHASLFPDLIGASLHSNMKIEEYSIQNSYNEDDSEPANYSTVNKKTNEKASLIARKKNESGKLQIGLMRLISHMGVEEEKARKIVPEIVESIYDELNVDWYKRQPILAEIRTKIRSVFRSHGQHFSSSHPILTEILELMKRTGG